MTLHAFSFICYFYIMHSIEEHMLRAQYNVWQDRKYVYLLTYGLTISHLTTVHWCSLITCTLSALVCLVWSWCWGEVECATEKSPVRYSRKDVSRLNKCNSFQEAEVVGVVANPSSTPVLILLNIFNVKLKKKNACFNTLHFTAKYIYFKTLYTWYTYT